MFHGGASVHDWYTQSFDMGHKMVKLSFVKGSVTDRANVCEFGNCPCPKGRVGASTLSMGHAPDTLKSHGVMGQLREPFENGNTKPRSVEYTLGLLASHKKRQTAFTMSHVGGMHWVDVSFHCQTPPAAELVLHVMVDEDPKYTPVEIENATSWSGSPAARAKHCVKLKASDAEQNSLLAVEHVVLVVVDHAPLLHDPFVQDPTVMSGH